LVRSHLIRGQTVPNTFLSYFVTSIGISFVNAKRNAMLGASGVAQPKVKKTGTTIVGIVYKDGVVLGADTRATEGSIVCDKNCWKIHNISKNIWCCGAGTSADTEAVTGLIASQLELHRLETGSEPRVVTALTRLKQRLFQYQGHISAALVLGGIDATGSHLYTVYPHGSTDRLPFATMGSGSLAAMSVFEAGYKDNMDEKEAKELVNQAIMAGIFNDLGSGGNVDVTVISKITGVTSTRTYLGERNPRPKLNANVHFPIGKTEWTSEKREVVAVPSSAPSSSSSSSDSVKMDTSSSA